MEGARIIKQILLKLSQQTFVPYHSQFLYYTQQRAHALDRQRKRAAAPFALHIFHFVDHLLRTVITAPTHSRHLGHLRRSFHRNHAHSIKSNRTQSGRHVSFCDFGQIACDVIYLYPVCSSLYKFDTIHAVYNNHVYRFSIAFVSEPRMHMASEALMVRARSSHSVAQKL